MSTLVAILAHAGAQSALALHQPFYERCECDIIGIGPVGVSIAWPRMKRFIGTRQIGEANYAIGGPRHTQTLVDVLKWFAGGDGYNGKYHDICITEWDGVFVRPVPPMNTEIELTPGGSGQPGFHCSRYFHTPWRFTVRAAASFARLGQRMIDRGLVEQGYGDQFLGLAMDRGGWDWSSNNCFSVNAIDTPEYLLAARKAITDGIWHVHGIKSAQVFKLVTQGA